MINLNKRLNVYVDLLLEKVIYHLIKKQLNIKNSLINKNNRLIEIYYVI